MNPKHWARIEAILDETLGKPAEERRELLEALCAGDELLMQEVEELLDADLPAFLDGDAAHFVASELDDLAVSLPGAECAPGDIIGPYRVLGSLGTGGMSHVYLCERADGAVRRRVAVKVLDARGPDAEQARQRFRAEGQILATLDHPHIARVFDSDVTGEGHSYLVMEYVEGTRLTDFCESNGLDLAERMRLMEDVCDAVQYAHQRLVVHRDLKPSNILVTATGIVKLLDFGIAKLLDPESWDLSQGAPMTRAGVALLTPEYAAPEQIRRQPVTTAADVYSLGVILYELMTGLRPHELPPGASLSEVERIVLRRPPLAPSVALAGLRQGEGRTHSWYAALRGDLDTIALKALRQESGQRYASVAELAEDLRAWRASRPIRARPLSLGYRAGKLFRRNKLKTILAAAGLLTLSGYAGVLAQKQASAAAERDRSRAEAERAGEVVEFLVGLFEASRPDEALGRSVTASELLEQGARMASAVDDKPLARAQMLDTIGRAYMKLGKMKEAEAPLAEAYEIRSVQLGAEHEDTRESLLALIDFYEAAALPQTAARFRAMLGSDAR